MRYGASNLIESNRETVKEKALKTVEAAEKPLTPKQIATEAKLNEHTVRRVVRELLGEGKLASDGNGRYFALKTPAFSAPQFADENKTVEQIAHPMDRPARVETNTTCQAVRELCREGRVETVDNVRPQTRLLRNPHEGKTVEGTGVADVDVLAPKARLRSDDSVRNADQPESCNRLELPPPANFSPTDEEPELPESHRGKDAIAAAGGKKTSAEFEVSEDSSKGHKCRHRDNPKVGSRPETCRIFVAFPDGTVFEIHGSYALIHKLSRVRVVERE